MAVGRRGSDVTAPKAAGGTSRGRPAAVASERAELARRLLPLAPHRDQQDCHDNSEQKCCRDPYASHFAPHVCSHRILGARMAVNPRGSQIAKPQVCTPPPISWDCALAFSEQTDGKHNEEEPPAKPGKGRRRAGSANEWSVYRPARGGRTPTRGSTRSWWRIWPDPCSLLPRFICTADLGASDGDKGHGRIAWATCCAWRWR